MPNPDMIVPVWLVWSPQGGAPTRQHQTEEEAWCEATRLIKVNPLKEFYVLKTVGKVVMPEPIRQGSLSI